MGGGGARYHKWKSRHIRPEGINGIELFWQFIYLFLFNIIKFMFLLLVMLVRIKIIQNTIMRRIIYICWSFLFCLASWMICCAFVNNVLVSGRFW